MKVRIKQERMSPFRSYYHVDNNKNSKKESIIIEMSKLDSEDNSILNAWKKRKWVNKNLSSYYSIQTYVTDEKGNCRGAYNPTIKLSDDKKRHVINFDYVMEVCVVNRTYLLKEVLKRFFNTDEKLELEII